MPFIVSCCCCSFSFPSRIIKSCVEYSKWFSDKEAKQTEKTENQPARNAPILFTADNSRRPHATTSPTKMTPRRSQSSFNCVSVIHEWNRFRMKECGSGRVRVRERDGANGREDHTCMPSPFCLYCNNTKRQGENCCCSGSWITQLENFGVDFTRHAFKSHLISLSFEL